MRRWPNPARTSRTAFYAFFDNREDAMYGALQTCLRQLLDTIAANKTPVMSYHFAWPGYGHVAKAGDGFHYYPEPMKMEL